MSDAIWSSDPPSEAGWYYRTRSSLHPDKWVLTWEEGNQATPIVGIRWMPAPAPEELALMERVCARADAWVDTDRRCDFSSNAGRERRELYDAVADLRAAKGGE